MTRRNLVSGLAASGLASASMFDEQSAKPVFYELTTYKLHNSPEQQSSRLAKFLQNGQAPALARAAGRLVGAFSSFIGPDAPYLLTIAQYATLAAMEETRRKLEHDDAYQRDLQSLDTPQAGYPFVRFESSLLRAFDTMPAPLLAGAEEAKSSRIFELRTYESQTMATLARKIKMFNDGEIGIFQRLGMRPVLFGQTIVGPRQPNLTYMLSYDSLAARETLWNKFIADPEWKKISSPPELKDAMIVSNISNAILKPLDFSAMR